MSATSRFGITVVIPVFNQVHLTKNCLESLVSGSKSPHNIVIIDNHSTDETQKFLKSFKESVTSQGWSFEVISNNNNVGVGAAFNQGIKAAKSQFVALLNNDTWIMPGWDEALLQDAKRTGAAMIGAFYDENPFDPVRTPLRALSFTKRNQGRYSGDWAAIFMFFRRDTFQKIGLFDERFFICYEDRDLRERLDIAGLTYLKSGSCFIWHKSKATRDDSKLIKKNYEAESLEKFIDKWGFDPRPKDNTQRARMLARWVRFKNKLGYL